MRPTAMQGKKSSIRTFGDPALRRPAERVEAIDDEVRETCRVMVESMLRENGAGIAAPQIGVSKRIIALDVDGQFYVLINPELVSAEGEVEETTEGCLSVPGVGAPVTRSAKATVAGTTLGGQRVEITGEGLLARAIQHEMDHLDGRLFLDRLSPARRRSLLQQYKRRQRDEEE